MIQQPSEHAWLAQIESLCAAAPIDHIDVIVDQMALKMALLPGLHALQPPIPWSSLFSGTPEEPLLEQAPLLMRITLDAWRHRAWLAELLSHLAATPRLTVLVTPMPFDVLATALQALSQLEWGGQNGMLRFYDPRVLPQLLTNVLDPEQRQRFLQLVLFWGWLDRDQSPVWHPGTYRCDQQAPHSAAPIALTDAQFDRLGCISDAQGLMTTVERLIPGVLQEVCFGRAYRWVLQASEENYFGDLKAYVAANSGRLIKMSEY